MNHDYIVDVIILLWKSDILTAVLRKTESLCVNENWKINENIFNSRVVNKHDVWV